MKKPPEKIAEFLAYLPPIQSAINIGQDGARIKIDVPETHVDEVLKLARDGREKVLRISVEEAGG